MRAAGGAIVCTLCASDEMVDDPASGNGKERDEADMPRWLRPSVRAGRLGITEQRDDDELLGYSID